MSKGENKKILIIDGDSSHAAGVKELLAANHYAVDAAEDWTMGLSRLDAFPPDLVMCVFHRPHEDFRAWEALRKKGGIRVNLPTVIISAHPIDMDFFLMGLGAGLVHFIQLPYENGFLLSRIEEAFASARRGRGDGSAMLLSWPGDNPRHRLSVPFGELQDFLFSAMQNQIEQNRLLVKILEENRGLGQGIAEEERKISPSPGTRAEIEEDRELIEGIMLEQFVILYQPIVSLETGRIAGFEALVRWHHPERGVILPDDFIPVAERSGLIIPIGLNVIGEVCRRLKGWQERFHATSLSCSINLSTIQFIHPELVNNIRRFIELNRLDPRTVRFEITESALMLDMDSANTMLLQLKAMGIMLYLDDFGTGYSSLSYLRHFPVDVLKIDKSFVRWMGIDRESDEIVRAVVNLAHNLRMLVIAEGVEQEDQLAKLRQLGCEYGQGYHFSRPITAEEAENLLAGDPVW